MSDYRKLDVWKKGRTLTAEVYRVTATFPRSEMFGLAQQMRRAASSIPSNVAEGHGRATRLDCCRFVVIARGSAHELETQLFLAEDLGFISAELAASLRDRTNEIGRMLNGLVKYYEKLLGAGRRTPDAHL